MPNSVFIPTSFFLLRVPVKPVVEGELILSQKNWIEALFERYRTDEWLREAVAIASPKLYDALQKQTLTDSQQIAASLLNYTLRMTNRATPFGLFSFVAMGQWKENMQTSIDLGQVCKRARPDMLWIYLLIQKIYSDDALFHTLSVRLNPLVRSNSNRLFMDYVRHGETKEKNKRTASIAYTKLVKAILNFSKEPIEVSALLQKLLNQLPQLDQKKAEEIIRQLLSNQFLLPGLLPSLLNKSPFDELLLHLPPSLKMDSLVQKIKFYNDCPVGQGEEQLAQLKKEMESLVESKSYLQVDSGYKGTPFQLSKSVAQEVEKAVNLLWKISLMQQRPSPLTNYQAKFAEKYGIYRTVPLLELLNEEKGLGSFSNATPLTSPRPAEKSAQYWENYLKKSWQDCLRNKKKEIFIDEDLLDYCLSLNKESLSNEEEAILSFDVFCKLLAKSSADITQGNFSVLLDFSTMQGCNSFGRFFDLLSVEDQSKLIHFFQLEESLEKSSRFVELSYIPISVRASNVAIHPCLRQYRLDLEAKTQDSNTISLNDIYVGITKDRFYLTLKDGKYEIEACISNLLNLSHAPLALQFMREVTLAKRQPLLSFFWGAFSEMAVFLPRVCYQKTILSPAQWKLEANQFSREKPEQMQTAFISWADQWELPKFSFLIQEDLHLLIDREHPAHLREIIQRLQKGETLVFIEKLEQSWLKSEKGYHTPELVIPFIKNPASATKARVFHPPSYTPISLESRLKFPSSDWLYMKFYLGNEGVNRFLIHHLVPFAEQLQRDEQIDSWFFVRYYDPDSHLRLRFRLSSEEAFSIAMPLFKKMFIHWMGVGLIRNVILDSYEREIERYGGPDLIDAAEAVFCADSLATVFLLQALSHPQFASREIIFHTLSIIHFLRDLGLDQEEMLSFLPNDQKELNGFRGHKAQLIKQVKAMENFNNASSTYEGDVFKKASELRLEAIQSFSENVHDLNITPTSIYGSLLHMHCNRLGCMANAEKQAMAFAHHTLLQLQLKQAHTETTSKLVSVYTDSS